MLLCKDRDAVHLHFVFHYTCTVEVASCEVCNKQIIQMRYVMVVPIQRDPQMIYAIYKNMKKTAKEIRR
jgi:hypothetical protein